MTTEESGPSIDKQGRIIDPFNGRPLRDRRSRSFGTAPFRGKEGKPHPRTKKLEARIEAWAAEQSKAGKSGRRKPGSLSK